MSSPKKHQAEIGVIGGSGFYSLIKGAKEVGITTPHGDPSDKIALGSMAGRPNCFFAATWQESSVSSPCHPLSG